MTKGKNHQPRRLRLIVNPVSGTSSKLRISRYAERKLRASGYEVETCLTAYAGHATKLAKEAVDEGCYAVVACGGDGTVNEVARALCHTETVLGIIPTGSGNGLARHVGIPVDVDRSLRVIAENRVVSVDYGTANERPFFCTFGVGFDAAVSERFARQRRRGLVMYLKSVIDEFVQYNPEEYIIEVDGKTITERAFLVVCCNASQYGNNAFIAPQASVTDGQLDLTIVHCGNLFSQAIVGVDLLTGFIGKNALIDTIRTSSATIRRKNPASSHLDGDPAEMAEVIDIVCHPGALKMFVPTKKTRFFPILTPAYLLVRDIVYSVGRLLRITSKY